MRRVVDIIAIILVWCAAVALIVLAVLGARNHRTSITIRQLRITIDDPRGTRVVTTEKITDWLLLGDHYPIVGLVIDSIDTRAIENELSARPEVKKASVWSNLDGIATIKVTPREPSFRVQTTDGHSFWYTSDGYILADRGEYLPDALTITGSMEFPFSTSTQGSYAQLQADNYNDFLEQFTALETERKSLVAQRSSVRTALRAAQNSGPKRFWGAPRREQFEQQKVQTIARLEGQLKNLDSSLGNLARRKRALQEKEFFSYESHRFLPKLANFVNYIEDSDFWHKQVAGISVGWRHNNKEPQIEITPRLGSHTVDFGALDGTEIEKLEKLKSFYIVNTQQYSHIDVKYKNQIICVY